MAKYFVSLVCLFLLIGCSSEEVETVQPDAKFIKYISAFTSGTISKKSKIKIEFSSVIAGVEAMETADGILEFEPEIEGQAIWLDDRTLEFQPTEVLPSGQRYNGQLNLKKVYKEIGEEFEEFTFSFQTMTQAFDYEILALEPVEGNQLKWQRLKGEISTADFASYAEIEKMLSAKQSGRQLSVKWNHFDLSNTHEFIIDSIQRKEEAATLLIDIKGAPIGVEESKIEDIDIPSLKDFSVFKIKAHSGKEEDDQYIEINFSDPLQKQQNLSGLIYFEDGTKLRTRIQGNTIKVYPEKRFIGSKKIVVDKAVKNILGYPLKRGVTQKMSFVNYDPAVEFIGEGTIIPSSKGTRVPFKAVNLNAVDVTVLQIKSGNVRQFFQVNSFEDNDQLKRVAKVVYRGTYPLEGKGVDLRQWNNFALDLDNIIETDPGAIYRIALSFKPKQSLYPCESSAEIHDGYYEKYRELEDKYYQTSEDWYYGGDFSYNGSYYDWSEKNNPCHSSYYVSSNNRVIKNVFASNIGIIAKGNQEDNYYSFAITSISDAEPIAGAKVKVIDLQGDVLFKGSTNGEGFIQTKRLQRIPFLVSVEHGKEYGYLRLNQGDALSQSMFDVNGNDATKGLKGMIYGERGVWRPGDTLFLSFILEDKLDALPENHPVTMEVYTPENKLYKRIVKTNGVNGFYDFIFKTSAEDVTGNWNCKVNVGGSSFYKSLRIENVKPNRLKIEYDFEKGYLSRYENQDLTLTSRWLHGAKGKNLKADVEMTLESENTKFKGFEQYIFDDPTKKFHSGEKMIFEGRLNAEGKTTFSPNIKVTKEAPGMLNCKLKTRVFENGGDFSVDVKRIAYAPYNYFVGFQMPEGEGWRNALYSDQPNLINILSLDPNGKPVGSGKVKIEVYTIDWSWWWDHSGYSDLGSYIRRSSNNMILSDEAELVDGKLRYELNFENKSWGRKFIRITHENSGHSSGTTFFTTYSSWWNESKNMPSGAEMLDFSMDKKSYKVGEEAFVKLPNAKEGKVLVSIEKNSRVVKTIWHDLGGGALKVPIEEGMAPNFYLNLMLIQPHEATKNDAPIRMYGVQSVDVTDPSTTLKPLIDMPEELAPEEMVTIRVKEANGKDMNYTLAVVDEGLLDLTRFQTPDPFSHFYAKEALKVSTWDLYDDVMGAFGGKIAGLLAIGGGDLVVGEGKKKLQRFTPVVRYFKPRFVEGGEVSEITFRMPNYVGSVRVMVVAGHEGAYGNAEKAVPVTKPLMVFPTLPRVVRPNETIEVPVSLFVMDKLDKVNVRITAGAGVTVVGETQKEIAVSEEGEIMTSFTIKTGDKVGESSIKIDAFSGAEKSYFEVGLPITVSTPKIYSEAFFSLKEKQKVQHKVANVYVPGTESFAVELSKLPSLNLENKLNYLIGYPHGCLEQTTSKVMAQLYLSDVMNLTDVQTGMVDRNLNAGISKLRRMQKSSGGFSYWSGSANTHDWGSSYAGHFLILANKKGYNVPDYVINNWERYQRSKANTWRVKEEKYYSTSAQQIEQAYRLYTLAVNETPLIGAMNRLKNETLCEEAAVLLAGSYAMVGQENAAKEILGKEALQENYYNPYTFSSSLTYATIQLEVNSYLKNWDKCAYWLKFISDDMKENRWHSTRSIGAAVKAFGVYLQESDTDSDVSIQAAVSVNGKSVANIDKEAAIVVVELGALKDSSVVEVQNKGKSLFAFISGKGNQRQGSEVAAQNGVELKVNYYHNNLSIQPSEIKKGMDIEVEVMVRNTSEYGYLNHLALNYLFSSAWEYRNMRMEEESGANTYDHMDIRDDRVYTYFSLSRNQTRKFTFDFHVVYEGDYYLPAIMVEHMYKNQINAVIPGAWQKF